MARDRLLWGDSWWRRTIAPRSATIAPPPRNGRALQSRYSRRAHAWPMVVLSQVVVGHTRITSSGSPPAWPGQGWKLDQRSLPHDRDRDRDGTGVGETALTVACRFSPRTCRYCNRAPTDRSQARQRQSGSPAATMAAMRLPIRAAPGFSPSRRHGFWRRCPAVARPPTRAP
jgi:hypothetical protein